MHAPAHYTVRYDDLLALWAVVRTRAPDFALDYHASRRAAETAVAAHEKRLKGRPDRPAPRRRAKGG